MYIDVICCYVAFADAVVRNVYYKYFHPKEALVSNGVLNRFVSYIYTGGFPFGRITGKLTKLSNLYEKCCDLIMLNESNVTCVILMANLNPAKTINRKCKNTHENTNT